MVIDSVDSEDLKSSSAVGPRAEQSACAPPPPSAPHIGVGMLVKTAAQTAPAASVGAHNAACSGAASWARCPRHPCRWSDVAAQAATATS